MWKTISFYKDGRPHLDINTQGVIYDYGTRGVTIGQPTSKVHPYLRVSVRGNKEYVHHLVAQAFPEICGEWFDGCEVHHKDCNPTNNDANNLIVCTPKEHDDFHKKIKEKKRLDSITIEDIIASYKKKGEITIKYYCRWSKVNSKGLSPIEISINCNSKRKFFNTPFKANPKDFINGKLPFEFIEYTEHIQKLTA